MSTLKKQAHVLAICVSLSLLLSSFTHVAFAVAPGNAAFERTWARTDKPVADLVVARTWMWGPSANTGIIHEEYAESPDGMRDVQYFDKSRMEITHPDAVDDGLWYVTNGLLVVEMVTQRIQIGDALFTPHHPADIPVAGDPDDTGGPTYATFAAHLGATPDRTGQSVTATINRAGNIGDDPAYAEQNVTYAHWDEITQHNVALPFWEFMNSHGTVYENGAMVIGQMFLTPVYATGRPITEPYWSLVKVGNVVRPVLVQCFERRCLTYTPGNPDGWKVESGNVGQHYFCWRYTCANPPPADTPTSTATATPTGTATATGTSTGTATATGTSTGTATATGTSTGTATATGTSTGTATATGTSTGTATATGTSTGTATATGTSTGTATATGTSTTPGVPDIDVEALGIVVSGVVQFPTELAAGVGVVIGARIFNHANVAEVVNVVTTYDCPLANPVTINQGQTTIPANGSTIYQFNWAPPGIGAACVLELTATTVRTPSDSDSDDWLVLLSIGGGTPTSTSTPTPSNPDIDVTAFGVIVGGIIQTPDSLAAGVGVTIGARIRNNANVAELVNVITTYDCPLSSPVTINQGQTTVPANGEITYQFSWSPPGIGLLCTVEVAATTVRTPVSSDSEDWLVLLSVGGGGGGGGGGTPTPTAPDINVQAFGIVAGVNISIPSQIQANVLIPIGARIENHANVDEEVHVTLQYRFWLGLVWGSWQSINQGSITVPANSDAIFQRNWTPPGVIGSYQVRVTATTIRTPTDSDTEIWAVVVVNLLGSPGAYEMSPNGDIYLSWEVVRAPTNVRRDEAPFAMRAP